MERRSEAEVGARVALVVDNVDPHGGGRVQVSVTALTNDRPMWARVATLAAGDRRGTWFLPMIGDEVLVVFEDGDPRQPVVVGSLWHAGDTPPETGAAQTERMTIRTRSGAVLRIEDPPAPAPATITIDTANGDSVEIGPAGITITSASRVRIVTLVLDVEADAINLDASTVRCSGVVQCDTLVAQSVAAASYTPGAGNVW